MPTHSKLLLSATAVATVLGSASAVSGKCGNNTYSAANLSKSYIWNQHGGSGWSGTYRTYGFNCGNYWSSGYNGERLKDNAPDIDLPTGDAAAMKAACCNGPMCTGNRAEEKEDDYFWRPNDNFEFSSYASNLATLWDFRCGAGKHLKPNGNTIAVSGADTAAKQAVCCTRGVAGMCSGNTYADVNNGLDMPSSSITPSPSASASLSPSASPVFTGTYQLRCDSHTQLKPTSATITVSGATAAEKQTMCCDSTTPTNAAFFDKCSTITTRPHTTTTGGIEYDLAPASTFCGVGKEYDAAKAESTCAAGQCNQNTAADVTTCCKTSAPCANTDGTSANTVQCQVRTHTHVLLRHNDLNTDHPTKQF